MAKEMPFVVTRSVKLAIHKGAITLRTFRLSDMRPIKQVEVKKLAELTLFASRRCAYASRYHKRWQGTEHNPSLVRLAWANAYNHTLGYAWLDGGMLVGARHSHCDKHDLKDVAVLTDVMFKRRGLNR